MISTDSDYYHHHWRGGCPIDFHHLLGDGICDEKIRQWEDFCCYDGGDCIFELTLTCPSCENYKYAFKALHEKSCIPELYNPECCFSLGFCKDGKEPETRCDTCQE